MIDLLDPILWREDLVKVFYGEKTFFKGLQAMYSFQKFYMSSGYIYSRSSKARSNKFYVPYSSHMNFDTFLNGLYEIENIATLVVYHK